jgi:hypothetical protein
MLILYLPLEDLSGREAPMPVCLSMVIWCEMVVGMSAVARLPSHKEPSWNFSFSVSNIDLRQNEK